MYCNLCQDFFTDSPSALPHQCLKYQANNDAATLLPFNDNLTGGAACAAETNPNRAEKNIQRGILSAQYFRHKIGHLTVKVVPGVHGSHYRYQVFNTNSPGNTCCAYVDYSYEEDKVSVHVIRTNDAYAGYGLGVLLMRCVAYEAYRNGLTRLETTLTAPTAFGFYEKLGLRPDMNYKTYIGSWDPELKESVPTLSSPIWFIEANKLLQNTLLGFTEKWSTEIPYWHPDDDSDYCMCCHKQFSFINRRHHCRACGLLICADCSRDKDLMAIRRPGFSKNGDTFGPISGMQKICQHCNDITTRSPNRGGEIHYLNQHQRSFY